MQYLIVIFFDMAGLRCLLRSLSTSDRMNSPPLCGRQAPSPGVTPASRVPKHGIFEAAGLHVGTQRHSIEVSKHSLLIYCVRCVIVGDRCAVGMITISEILT